MSVSCARYIYEFISVLKLLHLILPKGLDFTTNKSFQVLYYYQKFVLHRQKREAFSSILILVSNYFRLH